MKGQHEAMVVAEVALVLEESARAIDPVMRAFGEFLASYRSPNTRRAYARDIVGFFGGMPTRKTLAQVDMRWVRGWWLRLEQQGLHPRTRNRHLAAVRRFWAYLVEEGLAARNLLVRVRPERVSTWTYRNRLSQADVRRLVYGWRDRDAALEARDRALIAVTYQGLLRRSEVAALRWGDLDREGRRFLLHLRQTKGGADQRVPLSGEVYELLRRYWNVAGDRVWRNAGWGPVADTWPMFVSVRGARAGLGISPDTVNRVIRRRAESVGLSGVHAHLLRHAGVTHLLEAGVGVEEVARLARHQGVRTLLAYDRRLRDLAGRPAEILGGVLGAREEQEPREVSGEATEGEAESRRGG